MSNCPFQNIESYGTGSVFRIRCNCEEKLRVIIFSDVAHKRLCAFRRVCVTMQCLSEAVKNCGRSYGAVFFHVFLKFKRGHAPYQLHDYAIACIYALNL